MSVLPFDNQLDATNKPQPFTGGSYGPPMPASTTSSGDNPFADVLNHVGAWNDALSGGTAYGGPSSPGGPVGGFQQSPVVDQGGGLQYPNNPNVDPADPSNPRIRPSVPPPPPPQPSTPRQRASAPPQPWSATNPMPKPSDEEMKNSETAANYYRSFAWQNPAFANITNADVEAYRAYPQGMTISDWYLAGHRAGDAIPTPADPNAMAPDDPRRNAPEPNYYKIVADQNAAAYAAAQPHPPATPATGDTPPPGGAAPPPAAAPPSGTQPGTTPPSGAAPPTAGTPPPDIQSLIDTFQKEAGNNNGPDIEKMLDPMFARQRQKLDEQLRASAALTPGRIESGGFGMNEGQALSDLSGVQSGKLADALQQQHLAQMQQNTQLIQLGTQAGMQKYVADLNADMTKFQVNTNADLQKWLDNSDNVLKKYGIDKGDVLARYQAELQLKGQIYSADRGVDAASLQAAAAHAAAAASAAASQANAQLQYQLGLQGLSVDREKNIGQYVLGLLGLGNLDVNSLNGILNGIMPGTVVVKP